MGEDVHDYPLDRKAVTVYDQHGAPINLGKGKIPLDLSLKDAFDTLQPGIARNFPAQEATFIPAAGMLGAHYMYTTALKWSLDTFNRINRPYYRESGTDELVGGMVMNETTFYYFLRQLSHTNLEHIKVELHQEDNWAMRGPHLYHAMGQAHKHNIFPLGLTSISPDAPVHNIRDRNTALDLYLAMEAFNEDRMVWLIAQSGGHQRFEELKATHPDFADAVAMLARPKFFDDTVYISSEVGAQHSCMFVELHDEVPAIIDDVVTGASLSKIGLAGVRSGAAFVFNPVMAKHIKDALDVSVEGLNYSSFMPLTLLHARHPQNAAFRQSITDYNDDLHLRSAYFAALHQTALGGRVLLKTLPKLNRILATAGDPLTDEPLTFGAIPGITLLPREAAGYFINIHFDEQIWEPAIGERMRSGMTAQQAMHEVLREEAKVLLTPINLKDRERRPMNVFRMNCHASFEDLTGIYARLRHLAEWYGLTPNATQRLAILPSGPTRPSASIVPDAAPVTAQAYTADIT